MDHLVLSPVRKVHQDALRSLECWLTDQFSRYPEMPCIEHHPCEHRLVSEGPMYRCMIDYLFHWALETQGVHLTRHEIRYALYKVAQRYGKTKEQALATG